jgi:hypothetical protein
MPMTTMQLTSCNILRSAKYFEDYTDGLHYGFQGWQHKK